MISLIVLSTREVLITEYFELTLIIYAFAVIVGVYSVYHLIRDRK